MRVEAMAPFGAKIELDLRAPLSPVDQQELQNLFFQHKLLYFPDQELSMEDQRRVCAYISPLDPDTGALSYVTPGGGALGFTELSFHSDLAFVRYPPEGLSLYGLEVEGKVGWTAFVNAVQGFQRLPLELQERISACTTVRVPTYKQKADEYPPHETPLGAVSIEREAVIPHYRTGEPILYVARGSTSRVVGLDQPESRALLDAVMEVLYDPRFILQHDWKQGDLLIWDNMALQHARPPLVPGERRVLQRVAMAVHPQRDQVPASYRGPAQKEEQPAGTA